MGRYGNSGLSVAKYVWSEGTRVEMKQKMGWALIIERFVVQAKANLEEA